MYNPRRLFVLTIVFCLSIGLCVAAFAQVNRGTIRGTVSDQSGAVVVGATVTAQNVATGVNSVATTGANGNFTIPFLPPGVYTVTVEQAGFKKAVLDNVNVPVGDTIRQDVTLTVGEVSQSVSIEAEGVTLKTETSELGTTISGDQILVPLGSW
jgi:hypothetical protein